MSNGSATPSTEPDLPASGPGSRGRRRFFLISFGVLSVVVLAIARDVLLPFLFAIVLAYVLSPVVDAGRSENGQRALMMSVSRGSRSWRD